MNPSSPAEELLAGRRALDGLLGVELVEDWLWVPLLGVWTLLVRFTVKAGEAQQVPESTDWYIVVEPFYPRGSIWVYPAKIQGITETFHHQRANGPGQPDLPWRTGNICVDTGARGLERYALNQEPWDARRRLKWHVQRALGWLEAAARDELILAGEPFELPEFPRTPEAKHGVAFNEDWRSFEAWQASRHSLGFVEYTEPPTIRETALVRRFLTANRKALLQAPWSQVYRTVSSPSKFGVWIRLPQLPVLEPWQAPTTWGELEAACADFDFDLQPLLEQASHLVRTGKPHLGLLGFPLPRTAGEQPVQMHWQAFIFPAVAHGREHPKGFRPTKDNQWRLDRRRSLSSKSSIEWLASANWGADEISSRGRVPEDVRAASIVIIGAGALGSVMGELLVRAGVTDFLVVDGDTLGIGNLVRHSLTMSDLGMNKAEAVAARLLGVSPNVQVEAITARFPPHDLAGVERMNRVDVIIDTTGSDEVIAALEDYQWPGLKLMISSSLNLGARRLYTYIARGDHFPAADFHRRISPWIERDAEEWGDIELPWEGVGCWNPVFPARIDDIWLLASAAVKQVISAIEHPPTEPDLLVIEQLEEDGRFGGVSIRQ